MRKLSSFSVLVACLGLIGASSLDLRPAFSAPTTKPTTQKTTPPTSPVKRGALSIVVEGQGSFEPIDPFEVRLKLKAYPGELTITSIAPNGTTVKKGDVLLEIDAAGMKRTLAASENEALAARANLEKAKADAKVAEQSDALSARQQEEAMKEAEQAVTWFETVDGPQMLKMVDLQLAASKNQMNDEQDELDQLKKMYKSEELTNATADIVVKRAMRQLDNSKTAYAMIQERANKVRTFTYPLYKQRVHEGLEATKQQYALFQASQQQGKVLRQTGLASANAAADAANLRLSELKGDADKLTVHAPSDGILAYGQIINGAWSGGDPRALRVGERVNPQTVLMTLYQPGRLRVVLELPESKFFAIQSGQKVSVSSVAFPELKYEGMCDPISHAPNLTAGGNYALTISTGAVDPRIVPGMKSQLHMDVVLGEDVVLVPTTSVASGWVWVKKPHSVEKRRVMTGRTDGKSIEILSGVRDGDEVLTQAKQ